MPHSYRATISQGSPGATLFNGTGTLHKSWTAPPIYYSPGAPGGTRDPWGTWAPTSGRPLRSCLPSLQTIFRPSRALNAPPRPQGRKVMLMLSPTPSSALATASGLRADPWLQLGQGHFLGMWNSYWEIWSGLLSRAGMCSLSSRGELCWHVDSAGRGVTRLRWASLPRGGGRGQ